MQITRNDVRLMRENVQIAEKGRIMQFFVGKGKGGGFQAHAYIWANMAGTVLGLNEDGNLWLERVAEALQDVADHEQQRLTWSGQHPEFMSSFSEELARLYDDLDYQRFLRYCNESWGEGRVYEALMHLDHLIQDYREKGYQLEAQPGGHLAILADDQWYEITRAAGVAGGLLRARG